MYMQECRSCTLKDIGVVKIKGERLLSWIVLKASCPGGDFSRVCINGVWGHKIEVLSFWGSKQI